MQSYVVLECISFRGETMRSNILVEALGDTPNLRILGFFIENPLDEYNKSLVAKLARVNRTTASKYISYYLALGYLIESDDPQPKYKLNDEHYITKHLQQFIDNQGFEYFYEGITKTIMPVFIENPHKQQITGELLSQMAGG